MTTYTVADYDRIATDLRLRLGFEAQIFLDPFEVLAAFKQRGLITDFISRSDSEMPGLEGHFDVETRVISFPETTLMGAKRGDRRAIWSIFHELGHVIFRPARSRNRSKARSLVERVVPAIVRDERAADSFAAAFAAPYDRSEYTPQTTAADIAARFRLNDRAATIRLAELGEIHRKRHHVERRLPSTAIRFLEEGRSKGHHITSLPARLEAAPELFPAFLGPQCTSCGEPALYDVGSTRALCANCRSNGHRFQDGDPL